MVHRFGLRNGGVDNMQILASRGYAVLVPDTPLRKGTPMLDLLKTVLPGWIARSNWGSPTRTASP